ncbi:serine-rich adhesin for platelets [Periplaneta americana]|uniref:serine-rich adhesin for platelets n=1 Tax=Periplaneta americana TaxID=6978 RepID=UPI0037E82B98
MVKCNEDGAPILQGVDSEKLASEDIIIPQSSRKNSRSGRVSSNGSSYGFRLQEQVHGDTASIGDKLERDTATSVSAYSTYKQRIDSMFDETRSQMSCYGGTVGSLGLEKIRPVMGSSDDEEGRQKRINNTVQARIEKMFAEMAQTGGGGTTKDMTARKLSSNSSPSPSHPSASINSFAVDYLGSVPLPDKVTSLQGLQEPLKDLYFAYRRAMETQPDRVGSDVCMNGTLEINSSGLKVHHKGQDKGELEQLNPFPTIAVWAAVKFVCRQRGFRETVSTGMEYAFLPLIADPEAIDKGALFQRLTPAEEKSILSTTQKGGSEAPLNHHSPMFAVVMRKMGVSRQLECHGFVCACSEDAIVIAANLYQALMNNMQNRSNNNGNKSSKVQLSRPKNQNGVNYVSLGAESSVAGDTGKSQSEVVSNASVRSNSSKMKPVAVITEEIKESVKDKKRPTVAKIPPPVPVRPPRRNKKSSASSASEDGDDFMLQKKSPEKVTSVESLIEKCPYTRDDNKSHRSVTPLTPSTRNTTLETTKTSSIIRGVRRTVSDRQNYSSIQLSTDNPEGGDILTKVAIPRSRSFLNAGGPLTRYNRRQGSGVPYGNGSGGSGSSPLGFNELFTEFRIQEGLNSMDDILDAIIDAEGMSFNDLKPIYKEFLLKLAVTLTKDELYQRSKSIMRRQKKKLGRRNSCYKRKKTFVTGGGGLKRVFRRSVNKLKPAKSRFNNFEFTSVLFPSDSIRSTKKVNKKIMPLETSSTSTSSYSTRTFKLHRQPSFNKVSPSSGGFRLQRKASNSRRRSISQRDMNNRSLVLRPQLMTSTSEDSDFFSMVRCGNHGLASGLGGATINSSRRGPNRSSSGYFSCSECSYDSESCTCISADKCYCSLGDAKKHPQATTKDLSLSSCGCDTDSCIESDKCYCAFSYHNRNNRNHHHSQHKHCIRAILDSHTPVQKPNHLRVPRNDSVIEQLKQRGFVASESSLSRAASPTTAWRRNEKHMTSSKKKDINTIKTSKSLEFLQINNPPPLRSQYSSVWGSRRADHGTNRRMDVYDFLPRRQSYQQPNSTTRSTQQRRSYSSDNLALDYDLFTTSSKSEDEDLVPQKPQRKVLVVSARDPRGRVIYMGASCRSDDGQHTKNKLMQPSSLSSVPPYVSSGKRQQKSKSTVGSTSAACEALSVKKSAEIAALFSDVKLTQTTDIVARSLSNTDSVSNTGEVFYNTLEPPDYFLTSKTRSSRNGMGSSLENSLGYLP